MMYRCAVAACVASCGQSSGPSRPVVREASVLVQSSGPEPKRRFQYDARDLAPDHLEVTLKFRTNTISMHGIVRDDRKRDYPTVKLTLGIATTEASSEGERIAWSIEDVSVMDDYVDPALRTSVGADVASLRGMRGTFERSSSGRVRAITSQSPVLSPVAK